MKTFFIVDGHSLLYRCHHAPFKALASPTGEPTKGTYMFLRVLFKMLEQERPDYLAVVFDTITSSDKKKRIFPGYKANKTLVPEISIYLKQLDKILRLLNVHVTHAHDSEADDVIASLATQAVKEFNCKTYVVTQDKDFGALLIHGDRLLLYDAHTLTSANGVEFYRKKGYKPEHVEAVLALAGDSADGVPPIGLVGYKTAAKLLETFWSDDGYTATIEAAARNYEGKVGESLNNALVSGALARNLSLTTLDKDIALEVPLEDFAFNGIDLSKAKDVFNGLGFHRMF